MKITKSKELTIVPNIQSPIVYFLLDNNEVVYVGQSKNGLARPYTHKDKKFTHIAFISCEKDMLDEKETEFIKKYKPKYNKMAGNSDYSLNRAKLKIRNKTNIHNFNIYDLRKLIDKFGVKTYAFENSEYIESCDLKKYICLSKKQVMVLQIKHHGKIKCFVELVNSAA